MKAVICKACGGNDLKKIGNCLVCQFCGTKFICDESDNIVGVYETERRILNLILESAQCRLNNNTPKELDLLLQALSLDEENTAVLLKIGRCYRELNMFDTACSYYYKVLALEPQNGGAYMNLGAANIIMKQYMKADSYLRKALELVPTYSPDYPVLLANYGYLRGLMGDKISASRYFDMAEGAGYDKNTLSVRRREFGIINHGRFGF